MLKMIPLIRFLFMAYQSLRGEKHIEEILGDYLIIRSSWLFAKRIEFCKQYYKTFPGKKTNLRW